MAKSYNWFADYWQQSNLGEKYKVLHPELQMEIFQCAMNAFAEGCLLIHRKISEQGEVEKPTANTTQGEIVK